MKRIYCPDFSIAEFIFLEGNAAHHLITVLRCKAGDEITLFDGRNTEYQTVVDKIDKKKLWLTFINKKIVDRESPLSIRLIQGISKGDRMDWVVQKSVELGISRISPIFTQHGAVKLDTDRMLKKQAHWQNIAISACEQCGRNRIPMIDPIRHFSDVIESEQNIADIRWILHPENLTPDMPPLEYPPFEEGGAGGNFKSFQLLVGPEGGFSEQEVSQAHSSGYTAMRLGPRILRTETAAIAAICALQTQFGDWFI